jgi:hypothetical protein
MAVVTNFTSSGSGSTQYGLGNLSAVPAGTTNGTPIGTPPDNYQGVRIYLPTSSSVTFTIASAQPQSAPTYTFTISDVVSGTHWDENLAGQNVYVTATSGSPLFRWY